jgi:hypothetical protein
LVSASCDWPDAPAAAPCFGRDSLADSGAGCERERRDDAASPLIVRPCVLLLLLLLLLLLDKCQQTEETSAPLTSLVHDGHRC